MKTTELDTATEIRAISNEDLDAVAGGLVTYHAGGGGKVLANKYVQESVVIGLGAFAVFELGPILFGL
jgi:hypothetical protein